MENDRLSMYLRARLRAMTYRCDSGVDDEAVRRSAIHPDAIHPDPPSTPTTATTTRQRQDLSKASA